MRTWAWIEFKIDPHEEPKMRMSFKHVEFPAVLLASLLCTPAAAQSPEHVRSWAAACANCHGTNGRAEPGIEGLAGVRQDDLVRKMTDFKTGLRPATLMHQIAKGYSDDQISAIAAYFAEQKK